MWLLLGVLCGSRLKNLTENLAQDTSIAKRKYSFPFIATPFPLC
jgi:hypothetical protein